MTARFAIFWLLGLALTACADYGRYAKHPPDPHSFAQPNEAKATHLQWSGQVDFASKTIIAKASWMIQSQKKADTIVFDTYGLDIQKVTIDDQQETGWVLDTPDPILGSALRIAIKPGTQMVHIQYRTASQAKGLQWLDAAQTGDKKHPFLFSQGQAILTRTWLPCQDSPSLRFSFDATVSVPAGLMAVMSAPNSQQHSTDGLYRFSNSQPIPSYLFALAVGDFSYKAFDGRSGIYAEKSTLDVAWQEFANLPPMIKAAERLFGKMPWQRFDVLVLPPSFPFGGMENPMIMFAAPTLIAGDRSLTNLVAHELAHTWSDQLVRIASWEDFWLNEFFTNYIERRIIEEIEGSSYTEMMESLSNLELEKTLESAGLTGQSLVLVPDLDGKDPDQVLGATQYLKVAALMMHMESSLQKKNIDRWIRQQLREGEGKVYTTQSFVQSHQNELFSNENFNEAHLNTWFYEQQLPKNYQRRISTRFASVEAVASQWLQGEEISLLPTGGWSVYEWMYFLRIINQGQLAQSRLSELDQALLLSNSGNAELQAVWLQLALQHNYLEVLAAVEKYVAKTGRRKLLLLVYKALWSNEQTRDTALLWFQKYGPMYHQVARNSISEILVK